MTMRYFSFETFMLCFVYLFFSDWISYGFCDVKDNSIKRMIESFLLLALQLQLYNMVILINTKAQYNKSNATRELA